MSSTQQLRGAVPSAIREAEQLMMAAARHPNLARALHTYLTGPFGDVYVPHKASGSQQLGSNRSGDLREALDQIYAAGIRHFDTASLAEIELIRNRYPDSHCHFMAPVRIPGEAGAAWATFGSVARLRKRETMLSVEMIF